MAADPRPIPLSLWIVAFSVLQFAFSRLPPPGPRPLNAAETPSAPGGSNTTSAVSSHLDRLIWNGQCVKDWILWRQLPKNLGRSEKNTPTECRRRCREEDRGYVYAGVQFGSECFCGNQPPQDDTIVDESECDWGCSGDQGLMCGARWRMNVFETGAREDCKLGRSLDRAGFGECCKVDEECEPKGTMVCHPGFWKCVLCKKDSDCTDPEASHCNADEVDDAEDVTCDSCTSPNHCGHIPGFPACNENKGQCVQCHGNSGINCNTPERSWCNDNDQCRPCQNDGECGHIPGLNACKPATPPAQRECVQCVNNAHCHALDNRGQDTKVPLEFHACDATNHCGYTAYMQCEVYHYGGNEKYPAGPGLIFRIYKTNPIGNVFKECHFHYKKGTTDISSFNCPYKASNQRDISDFTLLPLYLQHAITACHSQPIFNNPGYTLLNAVDPAPAYDLLKPTPSSPGVPAMSRWSYVFPVNYPRNPQERPLVAT